LLPLAVRGDNDGSRLDRDDRNVQRELCGRKMNTLIVGRAITGKAAFV